MACNIFILIGQKLVEEISLPISPIATMQMDGTVHAYSGHAE